MTLVSTTTLTGTAASITFSSIPQTATDLIFQISARSDANPSSTVFIGASINGGAFADTNNIFLRGSGSAATSSSNSVIAISSQNSDTANTFGSTTLVFPNYAGSTQKSFSFDGVSENNATAAWQYIAAGIWAYTTAITSVSFSPFVSSNFVAGTTISLYTITKGSGGATVS
jgi:hypothetical protein